jgi:hypothetical protein
MVKDIVLSVLLPVVVQKLQCSARCVVELALICEFGTYHEVVGIILEGSRSEFATLIGVGPGLCGLPRILFPCTPVNRVRSGSFQRSLSLLVSNLSRISSKAPVPMRAPPEKGCSMAPTVNKTSPITAARVPTISLCAHVFSRPNR